MLLPVIRCYDDTTVLMRQGSHLTIFLWFFFSAACFMALSFVLGAKIARMF